jgi:hypothetical protein
LKTHDIVFTINDGVNKGKDYGFTLARAEGRKAWKVTTLFNPPPSMVKQRIEITITAREDNIPLTGVRELKRINEIVDDLNAIFEQTTPVTLVGLDRQTYSVLVDKEGPQLTNILQEKEREPEYQVVLLCWGIYT